LQTISAELLSCYSEDDAYHDCRLAGYTSDEARNIIYNLEQLTEDSSDQSNLVENFWNEVGFPKGSRWWESDKVLEGSMSNHDKSFLKTSSNSDTSQNHTKEDEQDRSKMKQSWKKGFYVRPWKGPLPKRRSPDITLAAYFSKESESSPVQCTNLSRPSQKTLFDRAKNFGRSWWDLFPTECRARSLGGAIKTKEITDSFQKPNPTSHFQKPTPPPTTSRKS
jgi:hypothetical protein